MSILNANWSAVAAVALALLDRDTLTGGVLGPGAKGAQRAADDRRRGHLGSGFVSAYEDHLRRLSEDSSYRHGFEHGLAGEEADNYPEDPTEATAWGDGWRNGIASHRMNTITHDLEKAIAEAINAGAADSS
jgi:hypothetical protein